MRFTDDETKYQAILNRDPQAEGEFVYGAISTRIVCRPTCNCRVAMRKNVVFFDTITEAVEHGYRTCKRCKPEKSGGWNKSREFINKSCSMISRRAINGEKLNIDTIIAAVGVSKWHFYRMFKNYTGLTPRSFYIQCQLLQENPLDTTPLPEIETKRNLKRVKEILNLYTTPNSNSNSSSS